MTYSSVRILFEDHQQKMLCERLLAFLVIEFLSISTTTKSTPNSFYILFYLTVQRELESRQASEAVAVIISHE